MMRLFSLVRAYASIIITSHPYHDVTSGLTI